MIFRFMKVLFFLQTFTFSSRNPFQRFTLPNSGVDTGLMSVTVKANEESTQSVKYTLQENLFAVKSDSKIYYLQEIEDETI